MSTDNPKVSAYVPQPLKEQLSKFREGRGISESQAITIILAEYFGMTQVVKAAIDGVEVGGITLSRFDNLESTVSQMQQKLLSVTNMVGRLMSKPDLSEALNEPQSTHPFTVIPQPSSDESEPLDNTRHALALGPKNGTDLAARLNAAKTTLSHKKTECYASNEKHEEFYKWTAAKDPDGVSWRYDSARQLFYPNLPELELESDSSFHVGNTLSTSEMAKRLGVDPSTVSHRKKNPDLFPEWSGSKDKDGCRWQFIPEINRFSPVDELPVSLQGELLAVY